jgi:hypothetical protein
MVDDDFRENPQRGADGDVDLMEIKEIAYLAGKHVRTIQRWLGWPGFPRSRQTKLGHNGYPRQELLAFMASQGRRFRCAKYRNK